MLLLNLCKYEELYSYLMEVVWCLPNLCSNLHGDPVIFLAKAQTVFVCTSSVPAESLLKFAW
jgi:hypothetical protein